MLLLSIPDLHHVDMMDSDHLTVVTQSLLDLPLMELECYCGSFVASSFVRIVAPYVHSLFVNAYLGFLAVLVVAH
jgi:hypothetical protein